MSSCRTYAPRHVDPHWEWYGQVKENCGSCAKWDDVTEKCREEEEL